MQHPPKMEHYKSDIEDHEYQINRYQRFNLKPNRENMGSVSKSSLADIGSLRSSLGRSGGLGLRALRWRELGAIAGEQLRD